MENPLTYLASAPTAVRVAFIVVVLLLTHALVLAVRRLAHVRLDHKRDHRQRKIKSITTLLSSAIIFGLYFAGIGFVFHELDISLTAYFASASVIGLAIGFGSQGVVQDVVTGLTLIFSDLLDVGDLVEISGQTGIVQAITMRFVHIENALGASVFIPNRTINNVTNYPRGYVRCIVDVTLRGDDSEKERAGEKAVQLSKGIPQQFPGILFTEPSVEGRMQLDSGKEILRLKFRIWPNRGGPVESTYCQELAAELQRDDADFKPWMISVSYEVEARKDPVVAKSVWPWHRR